MPAIPARTTSRTLRRRSNSAVTTAAAHQRRRDCPQNPHHTQLGTRQSRETPRDPPPVEDHGASRLRARLRAWRLRGRRAEPQPQPEQAQPPRSQPPRPPPRVMPPRPPPRVKQPPGPPPSVKPPPRVVVQRIRGVREQAATAPAAKAARAGRPGCEPTAEEGLDLVQFVLQEQALGSRDVTVTTDHTQRRFFAWGGTRWRARPGK